jgi:hypothetical protein
VRSSGSSSRSSPTSRSRRSGSWRVRGSSEHERTIGRDTASSTTGTWSG